MVSTLPLISKSSSPFIKPSVITIGIYITFMFHSFSIPLQGPGTYPSFLFLLILFCGQPWQ